MRPEGDPIPVPEFPPETGWLNTKFVRVGTLLGQHTLLVWFWDSGSLNSLRTLPYLQEWYRRYAGKGLEIVGVHSPQFDFGRDPAKVATTVERLGIEFPVAIDTDFTIWKLYGPEVWPSLYLWRRTGVLGYFHFAEGEYRASEEAIGEALREIDEDVELPEPMQPLRATDSPGAAVLPPTPHQHLGDNGSPRAVEAGDELVVNFSGAGAYAVLDGRGKVDLVVDGKPRRTIELDGAQLYELVENGRHEQHELALRFRNEALAYAFSFSPAVAG